MDDTFYRDPMELFDPVENHDLYLTSINRHHKSFVFKFANGYGAHVICCEQDSTFSVIPLIFYDDYLFETVNEGKLKNRDGLAFMRMIDKLIDIKNMPEYQKPTYVPHDPTPYKGKYKNHRRWKEKCQK